MAARPHRILIVSEDRILVRHLSVFLGVAGYEVREAASVPLAIAALRSARPDFVIADGDLALGAGRELCQHLGKQEDAERAYLMLLFEEHAPRSSHLREMSQAVEAGADDFLTKPVVYGEVLARLQAGIQALEFERSWSREARWDPCTNLLTRVALLSRLERELTLSEPQGTPVACVVLDLDFFQSVVRRHGDSVSEAVLQAVAVRLKAVCEESALLAEFGGDRFAVVLPQTSDLQAAAWADELRQALAEVPIDVAGVPIAVTASFGVAESLPGEGNAQGLLARASEALQSAKLSGRDLVARWGDFEEMATALVRCVAPGRLFDRAVARDVMTPCTTALRHDECVGEAVALLRATGMNTLPVVDGDGRFVGIVEDDELGSEHALLETFSPEPISTVMKTDCVQLPENTSFETLLDFFARDRRSHIVIEQEGKPTGFVSRRNLASWAKLDHEGSAEK